MKARRSWVEVAKGLQKARIISELEAVPWVVVMVRGSRASQLALLVTSAVRPVGPQS